ncbi:MAG: tetraacyldisaccharide 4'-kinase [Bacteroidetes bacterium 24-39-8]|jgi:tetraacyldisaccharide 4'-kinase|nr:MAG: tetraacyldisaccharide 4'-kinase [Sphingobacteriia bacterium 35-40-8]OYZ48995.1 MAG: tetraacyldisaccharide 4'-kinase [Bacteroidetes bacterium 24-39-8]OZA63313.1 MAG: tetraacyldisaccharide 4'-kinase [Sphingobacteriia bacterium 39-39-8]HQR93541.1 tetraacyldisaccharide 4'-kinase [Sediminibacterium sp.]HQS54726.1 tetraacyldisaccharide 4'-kinase [Sediminibacterium sp.]
MNFNTLFLKSFRVLLFPFAVIYGLVVFIRNRLFDKGRLAYSEFNFPLICVGNIAVGGTGKSPMVEYLVNLLHQDFKVATLSRGYKRKTKGYVLAGANTTALEIGDEPMQFHLKFPEVPVAVGEERLVGIPHLLQDHPNLQAIILDDAFQHRTVKAGWNILLTEYSNLYSNDFFLPTGDLRDEWASAKRAQVIVVTKCPATITEEKKQKIIRSLQPEPEQKVFFTTIEYGTPYHIFDPTDLWILTPRDEALLVCGIANPKPLKDYLHNNVHTYYQQDYSDHHIFSIDDFNEIKEKFNDINARDKLILTTEKDAVRFSKFTEELAALPMYVLPIRHQFLFGEAEQFNQLVKDFILHFSFNPTKP